MYGIKDKRMNLLLEIAEEHELNVLFNWGKVVVYGDEYEYNESIVADTVQEALQKLVYESDIIIHKTFTLNELEALNEEYYERAFVQYLHNIDTKIKQCDTHLHREFFNGLYTFEDIMGIYIERDEFGLPKTSVDKDEYGFPKYTYTITGKEELLSMSDNNAYAWMRTEGILARYNEVFLNGEDDDYYLFTLLDNVIDIIKHGYLPHTLQEAICYSIAESMGELDMAIAVLDSEGAFQDAMELTRFNKYGEIVEG